MPRSGISLYSATVQASADSASLLSKFLVRPRVSADNIAACGPVFFIVEVDKLGLKLPIWSSIRFRSTLWQRSLTLLGNTPPPTMALDQKDDELAV